MKDKEHSDEKIVVAIPCYNEEKTVATVVTDFKKELPNACIVVIDNRSSDKTVAQATQAGALVIKEHRPGKGWAIQKLLSTVDADIYVLVDGDDTYFASNVHEMIEKIKAGNVDMVVGSRLRQYGDGAFRPLHIFGNHAMTFLLNVLFRTSYNDILSGYRVFSREFVENVPLITGGFQTEVEMTIQAIEKSMVIEEVVINYKQRPQGSTSKLNTFRDGWLILLTMAMYVRDHNPLRFFLFLCALWVALGETTFFLCDLQQSEPFQIAALQGMIVLGGIALFVCAMILSAVNTRFKEINVMEIRRGRKQYDAR